VIIHPEQHDFKIQTIPASDGVVIRKRFVRRKKTNEFENEHRVLTRNEDFILFPFIGTSLSAILQQQRSSSLRSDTAIYRSLHSLCGAIDSLHNFHSPKLDGLSLIGCHHDLKPANILVPETTSTFVLADFGVTTLVTHSQGETMLFPNVQGEHVAPECERYFPDRVEKRMVDRKSDIWSLGCILANLLTYMRHGPTGVERFRTRRMKVLFGYITTFRFHYNGEPCPGVEQFLRELEIEATEAQVHALRLTKSLLRIDPEQRPAIATVSEKLASIVAMSERADMKLSVAATSGG